MRVIYSEYMNSAAWREKKMEVFRSIVPNRCYCCNRKRSERRPFEVHHIRYTNLGNEPLSDLVMVCLICHGLIHNHAMKVEGLSLLAATERVRAARTSTTGRPFGPKIIYDAKPQWRRKPQLDVATGPSPLRRGSHRRRADS